MLRPIDRLIPGGRVVCPTGLVLGPVDEADRWFNLASLEGWDNPSSTGTVTQKAYESGGWRDRAFYQSRVMAAKGQIMAPSRPLLEEAVDDLLAAIPGDELGTFVVEEASRSRAVDARLDGSVKVRYESDFLVEYDVPLICPDSRRWSEAWHQASTGLPASAGGLTISLVVPFVIGGRSVSGLLSIVNLGTADSPPRLRIDGPVSFPEIRVIETGQAMRFALDLEVGQWLEVDCAARTVLLNGTSSRRAAMIGDWISLAPGTTTITWSAKSPSTTALLTVLWRDAWR